MNPTVPLEQDSLLEMRRAFDQSFATPAGVEPGDRLSLILIRVGGEAAALRADQITGIARQRRVVPVPSRVSESLGITAIRGVLLPVFSLAALLGAAQRAECAWVALARSESPLALAFDGFEGQTEVRPADCYDGENAAPRRHVRQLARIAQLVRPVIDIPSIVEAIRMAAARSRS